MTNPPKLEIDHHTLKMLVGLIALSLGNITSFFASSKITSISAAYYERGWAQTFFIGFLFAIATFLLAYNGRSWSEMLGSKVAALGALGVALFPCGCDGRHEPVPYVHFASAAVMFLVLTYFCYLFYKRARSKSHREANRRAVVYAICGLVIVSSIATLVLNTLVPGILKEQPDRLVFYCERSALVAFGVSWLTASRVLPFITKSDERFSLV